MEQQKFIVETLRQAYIDNQPSYCELVFLSVSALSMDKAEEKAKEFIKGQEKTYQNLDGQDVIWKFLRIVGINPIISEDDENVSELQAHIFNNLEDFEKSEALKGFDE